MRIRLFQARPFGVVRGLLSLVCAALLAPGDRLVFAQPSQDAAPQQEQAAPAIPADQLDSLVAPIALYPDPLLAQVLAASTYPLEIVQLYQWLGKNKGLKDKALEDAVMKQDWDPSVQGLAPMPDLVKQLYDNIKWTTDLGNAFLAQQADVMEAVQRMRKKAQDKGTLKTTEQQKVQTEVVESKQVIVIQQANPEVIYVPSYSPTVVYGAPAYPYYPYVYPPGYVAAGMAISFGVGLAMGAAWGGGWGYGCGWGGGGNNTININNNNNYNRNNINNGNRTGGGNRVSNQPARGGSGNWQHNPSHRGGAPYGDRGTANKFGGSARGDSVSNRQANARQNQGNRQQPGQTNRGGASASNRQQPGQTNRGGASASNRQQSGAANRGGGGGQDRVGNRSVPSGGSSRGSGGFGGGSGGYSGSSAKASSSRGSSSMGGSRGGGGGSRSGGGGRRR